MRQRIVAGLVGLWVLATGCSSLRVAPVRPSLFVANTVVSSTDELPGSDRFQDTVVLTATLTEAEPALHQTYDRALLLFQQAEYERAAPLFRRLAEEPRLPDSLSAEALFYAGECNAATGHLEQAQSAYEQLLQRPVLHRSLRERALLRLGHVFCAQGREPSAAEVFARLRREFPRSRYLPLANCASVAFPQLLR
ncbi:MAG: tetratricopeptide repeat protein [Candidatus Kapabacteria bacterium]|nr:tetratricopeptide repeat protein [Candidatus Kapabacteria bacterium]MCS7169850.1 tetratricopeptide repeat protein [Candidatus Kapabacteria bacterium]MDW7996132.1 tetratricopeptide repeat protein [Bacteroidota bacterium]MDW8225516.1 tetratricopeptide repeat protein [Bacteroidota bacterium]